MSEIWNWLTRAIAEDRITPMMASEMAVWLEAKQAEIGRLQAIIAAKLHQRRCHDCGHVGWHADFKQPYCLCEKCGSQDTRRVVEKGA